MPTIVTIGNFDGVHAGHAALLRAARAAVEKSASARVVAMVFDPHPSAVLAPDREPPRLSTLEQRREWLQALGADEVVRLEPTRELLSQSPETFVKSLVERWSPVAIVEGADFRFGKGRAGDVRLLADLGRNMGFRVEVAGEVTRELEDQTIVRVSSTLLRWLIAQGRVRDAARLLDRSYEVTGQVERGDRKGRTIGFPTANIATEHLLPADGVYAGIAVLPTGERLTAAISVGTKPHFRAELGARPRTLEAHFPGAPREADGVRLRGLDEYGWSIRLQFAAWLREQWVFPTLQDLIAQLHLDCARTSADPQAALATEQASP